MGTPSGEVAVPETAPWEPALAGGDSATRVTARPSVVFIDPPSPQRGLFDRMLIFFSFESDIVLMTAVQPWLRP